MRHVFDLASSMVWQYFVRQWVQKAATDKLREAAAEAVKESAEATSNDSNPDEPAPPPPPAELGIIMAHSSETGGIVDRLEGVIKHLGSGFTIYEGGLAGRRIAVVVAGIGAEAATHATKALIEGHHPQWILAAGFASGLQPTVTRGDILMATSVADLKGHELRIDLNIDPESLAEIGGIHTGKVLSIDQEHRTTKEKQAWGKQSQALGVDRQSLAVAEVCRQEKTRFLALRVVSDTAQDELPGDIRFMLDQKSVAGKLGAATGALFRRPGSAKDYWQIKEDALRASDRLADFLVETVPQLLPRESAGP